MDFLFIWMFFPGLPKELGWIIVPPQCHHQETASCHTINLPHAFPDAAQRNLPDWARIFGFEQVKDRDGQGRNISHLLSMTVKYCWLSAEIALICFSQNSAKMIGDYAEALSQLLTGGQLVGYGPLHILCTNSDACLIQVEIVKTLLDNKMVTVQAFEERHTSASRQQVIVF